MGMLSRLFGGAGARRETWACPHGSTFRERSRILGVVRGPAGIQGLVYTGLAADPRGWPEAPGDARPQPSAVVRRFDVGTGVRWEHEIPWSAYEDVRVARSRDRIVVPGDESGSLVGLDALTGRVCWTWRHEGRLRGRALGIDNEGYVLALYEDRCFAWLDPDSGAAKERGRHEPDEEPYDAISPMRRETPEEIRVGDCLVELGDEAFLLSDEEEDEDTNPYVHRVQGQLDRFLHPVLVAGSPRTREQAPDLATSRTGEVRLDDGWHFERDEWFACGSRLGAAVEKRRDGRWWTAFALYDLAHVRLLGRAEFGRPGRPTGRLGPSYLVDEVAVVHCTDSPVDGDAFSEFDLRHGYPAAFLFDCRSDRPALAGRITESHGFPSRLFGGDEEVWVGVL